MGSPTDASCTKETTVNCLRFLLSFALCYFLALFLMPKTHRCSKTHFVQLSVCFYRERATVAVDLGRSWCYKVTLTIGYSRNTEKQLYKKLHRGLKEGKQNTTFFSPFSLCACCAVALRLSHSLLQIGLLPLSTIHCLWNGGAISRIVGTLILLRVLEELATEINSNDCFVIHSYLSLFFFFLEKKLHDGSFPPLRRWNTTAIELNLLSWLSRHK